VGAREEVSEEFVESLRVPVPSPSLSSSLLSSELRTLLRTEDLLNFSLLTTLVYHRRSAWHSVSPAQDVDHVADELRTGLGHRQFVFLSSVGTGTLLYGLISMLNASL
jgi:hypothetical protein